jgi:hypothetical protein
VILRTLNKRRKLTHPKLQRKIKKHTLYIMKQFI